MSGGPRYRRIGRGHKANVTECFPSSTGGKRGPMHRRVVGDKIPAEDREPRAIRCYQCGCPIEDWAKYEECPSCGSDNVLGKVFT